MFCKKDVLKISQNSQENTYENTFCEVFKNTFFAEHHRWLLLYPFRKTIFYGSLNPQLDIVSVIS